MPKLKTHSGAKKRFSLTASGKINYKHAGKRHGMIKKSAKQIRDLRQGALLAASEEKRVKKYLLPNQ